MNKEMMKKGSVITSVLVGTTALSGQVGSIVNANEIAEIQDVNEVSQIDEKVNLEEDIDKIRKEVNTKKIDLDISKEKVDKLNSEFEKTEMEFLDEFNKSKENANKDFEDATNRYQDNEDKIKNLTEEKESLDREKVEGEKSIIEKENNVNSIKENTDPEILTNIENKKSEIDKLTSDIASKTQEISNLNDELGEKSKELDALNSKKDELNKAIDGLQNQKTQLEQDIINKTEQLNSSKENLDSVKEEAEKLKPNSQEAKEINNEITEKTKIKENLEDAINGAIRQINDYQNSIDTTKAEKTSLENQINDLNNEIDTLQNKIDNLNTQLDSKDTDITSKQTEITNTETEISSLTNEKETLERDIQNTRRELDAEKETLKNKKSETVEKSTSIGYFKWILNNDKFSPELKEMAQKAIDLFNNKTELKEAELSSNPEKYKYIEDYTHIGEREDATHIENMKKALEGLVQQINDIRTGKDLNRGVDENFGVVGELKVNDLLMAIAQLRSNVSSIYVEHAHKKESDQHHLWSNVGENLAWSFDGYKTNRQGWYTTSGDEKDFISAEEMAILGLYDEEKEVFNARKTNPSAPGQTGHYTSIMKDRYKFTGVAASNAVNADMEIYDKEPNILTWTNFGQVFKPATSLYNENNSQDYATYYARFMDYYNNVYSVMQSEIDQLKENIKAKEARLNTLLARQNTEPTLENRITEKQTDLENKREQLTTLQNEKQGLERKLDNAIEEKKNKNNTKLSLERQVVEKQDKIYKLSDQLFEVRERKSSDESQLDNITNKIDELNDRLAEMSVEYNKALEQIKSLEQVYSDDITAKAELERKLSTNNDELVEKQNTLNDKNENIRRVSGELDTLNERLRLLENDKNNLETNKTSKREELDNLYEQVKKLKLAEESLEESRDRVVELANLLIENETNLNNSLTMKTELEKVMNENKVLADYINTVEYKQGDTKKLNEPFAYMNSFIDKLKMTQEELAVAISELEKNNQEYQTLLAHLNEKIAKLDKINKQKEIESIVDNVMKNTNVSKNIVNTGQTDRDMSELATLSVAAGLAIFALRKKKSNR